MNKLYFIGIGGTAMGAVALACSQLGFEVCGSDANIYPPMSDFLRESGILYYEGFSTNNIIDANPDMIVVGNSVSRGNPELEYALDERMTLVSMPEIIRDYLIAKNTSIVISGTHGKTTTSSLTAWLLDSAGLNLGFLIGGIPGNYKQGCRPAPKADNGYFVSEGDEYDTAFFDKRSKFLLYKPTIAVINNLEFDHADIFSSLDDIKKSFRLFARLIPRNGLLLAANEDANVREIAAAALSKVETFGLGEDAFWRAIDIEYSETGTNFALVKNGENVGRFSTLLSGEHNLRNTLAAISVAMNVGISIHDIQHGLNTYKLPKRRLETIGIWNGCTIIDDFAHHPTAIAETLKTLRQKYKGSRIVACFEPRSNTTTRNIFQKELPDSFQNADIVCFGALNRPERYGESERLNTTLIAETLRSEGKTVQIISSEEGSNSQWGKDIYSFLEKNVREGDVIVLLSNGDFGGLRALLKEGIGKG
ncbi:MAG: UDP-N-acetylmuramate:L-alanyl-gamma-D-glutamyl-meso-diaminopimelate ligase [Ignavibacteriae bacterium]|nr:UDP-N-acetylmuramate:L-alanyl-gamma-D-glutamyl-meso-diaminopimelate ligase [Ignavibacteriota bacterium]